MPIETNDVVWDESSLSQTQNSSVDDIEWDNKDYGKASYGEVLTQAIKNTPKSAADYVKSVYKSVTSPVKTVKDMYSLSRGIVKSGVLRYMADELGYNYDDLNASAKDQDVAIAENMEDHFLNTYGTEEGFKQALANDPVGIITDVGSVIAPIAKGTGVGKVISKIEPISLATETASQALKLIKETVPSHMYQKAVRFSSRIPLDKQAEVAKIATSASNQIMPTAEGLTKLRKMIDEYNTKISNKISQSSKKGDRILITDIYKDLGPIKDAMKLASDEPLKVEAAFNTIRKNFREAIGNGMFRTPEHVQKLKQNIYKELASYYEQYKATPAKIGLRKAIAKNAREAIETIIPEIKQLNKKESELIELWDALETKANAISNRKLIGMGLLVGAGTGSTVGYIVAGESGVKVGTTLGLMASIINDPKIKAKMALVLGKLREKGITVDPNLGLAALELHQIENSTNEEVR